MTLKERFTALAAKLGLASKTVEMPRATLGAFVAPYLNKKGYAETNEMLSHGFEELKDWVRIGFHKEKPKGSLYKDCIASLDDIIRAVKNTPEESETIAVPHATMAKLKQSYCQMRFATLYLERASTLQNKYQLVRDRQGNVLMAPLIQIYNRPHESYIDAAACLHGAAKQMDNHFQGKPLTATKLNFNL